MQDVISQLAENQHIKFYFWRRKKEIEILDALSNSKDNVINVAGKMKLHKLALISNLDVMVSMDSGNAHIAAMLE
jgi:ADP-heptose:LPS heptosyltransferase